MVVIREANKPIAYNGQIVTYAENVVPTQVSNKTIEYNDKKEFSNRRNNTEYNTSDDGIQSTN